jgi:peroxiredoxin
MQNKRILAVVVLLAAVLSVYLGLKARTPFAEKKPAVGEAAPAVSLADLNGAMVSLSELKGKVVLVNFWASWCPPCTDEMPGFEKVFGQYEARGFSVIGIAVDDVKLSLLRDLRITYPVVKTNDRVTRDYGDVTGVPQSFLVGRDGRIIKKINQFYPESELRTDVEAALQHDH